MTNRLIALVAFVFLAGFLAILVFKVPRADLIVLVLVTLGLAGWDMLRPVKKK